MSWAVIGCVNKQAALWLDAGWRTTFTDWSRTAASSLGRSYWSGPRWADWWRASTRSSTRGRYASSRFLLNVTPAAVFAWRICIYLHTLLNIYNILFMQPIIICLNSVWAVWKYDQTIATFRMLCWFLPWKIKFCCVNYTEIIRCGCSPMSKLLCHGLPMSKLLNISAPLLFWLQWHLLDSFPWQSSVMTLALSPMIKSPCNEKGEPFTLNPHH